MRVCLLAFCFGVMLVGFLPSLCIIPWLVITGLLLSLLIGRCPSACVRRFRIPLFCAICGMLWHGVWAHQALQRVISPELEGRDIQVAGVVTSIPVATANGQRFRFSLHRDNPSGLHWPAELQLTTFPLAGEISQDPNFVVGEHWQLLVRLKRPHAYANPGSRDSEAAALRRNIVATGYVRHSESNKRLFKSGYEGNELLPLCTPIVSSSNLFSCLRGQLYNNLKEKLQRFANASLMLTLLMGERSGNSAQHWQTFSATGTTHLFVISGLHIGLVTMGSFFLFWRLLAAACGPVLPIPAQQPAAFFAILLGLFYAGMAGFTLPTQRAVVMATMFLAAYLLARPVSLSQRYLLALAVVLILDPLAPSDAGFWLSFSAVGVLVLLANKPASSRGIKSTLLNGFQVQLVVFIGMLIPLGIWMGQVSLIAPLVNFIAIPLVSLVLVPLLLIAALLIFLLPDLGIVLFAGADSLLHYLLLFLGKVAIWAGDLQFSVWIASPALLLVLLPGLALLLAPRHTPYKFLALPLCVPLIFPILVKPDAGELWVDVLDVGQGLAVLLRTRSHSLLFDTGASMGADWSAAAAVILPALKKFGVRSLDAIVISHGDNDHAGGAAVLTEEFPDADLMDNLDQQGCRRGQSWYWDDIRFSFLHPSDLTAQENNNSCVLHVQTAGQSLLLPGDIEADVEWDLAMRYGELLESALLIAPHHGSTTSSSYPFLKMVNPAVTVFSAGYRNAFDHPAQKIRQRYADWSITTFNTSDSGLLSFRLGQGQALLDPEQHRHKHRRYWTWSPNPGTCRYC